MGKFKYFTKIVIMKQWRATVRHVRVQRQGPRAMMTELEACLALVCASTNDDGRPVTGGTNLLSMVVDWPLQVGICINDTQKPQRFSS